MISNVSYDVETGDAEFDKLVVAFLDKCQRITDRQRDEWYPNTTRTMIKANLTPKYVKVVREDMDGNSGSVHCFIARGDSTTRGLGLVRKGDVLKPASYKVPAKGARGNLFDENGGTGRMGPYGPGYNR